MNQRLTLSWMARLLEGCTSTLCPAAVISLTCRGARGARLSHTLTSSRRIAMTLLWFCWWWWWWCWDLRWQHMQTLNPLPWLLTRRSMTGPVSKTYRLQLLHTSEKSHLRNVESEWQKCKETQSMVCKGEDCIWTKVISQVNFFSHCLKYVQTENKLNWMHWLG